ncbi:hypothetical protein M2436_002105 [Streptomyces sp. HB372]|nr:hypothetical protein [Streptomyces sp. HB372]
MTALSLVPDGEAAVAEEQEIVRSIFQRCRPSRSPDSMPGQAIRGTRLRSRSQRRRSAEWYALSARIFTGRRRRGPAPGADGGYPEDQRLERLTVMEVRPRYCDGQRQPLGLGQHVQFAALLAAINRTGAGQRAPLFARTDAASTIADDQSSSPLAPSSSNTARCSLRHNPASVHTEPAVRGGRRNPERLRQIPPRAPARQHVDHGREHRPLVHRSRTTALRTGVEPRQQRSGQLPQFVRNEPTRQNSSHDPASCRINERPRETSP